MTTDSDVRVQHAAALHGRGVAALQQNQATLAAELIGQALTIDPSSVLARVNYGTALHELGRFEEAVNSCDQAIALKPDFAEAFYNRGNALRELNRCAEAVASYERAIALKRDYADAYLNRGLALSALEQRDAAVASFDKVIAIRPDHADAHYNRANELLRLNRLEAAIAGFNRAIALQPGYASAHLNRGTALVLLRRHTDAIASYDRAVALDPGATDYVGVRRHCKMQICDWQGLEADTARIIAGIDSSAAVSNPFFLLPVCDSAELQQRAAVRWTMAQCPTRIAVRAIPKRDHTGRIHVGYFSADYHEHATSCLIAQLLELHDRSRFKITGFSFGPPSNGSMRRRLETACDDFIDVRSRSDEAVAMLARSQQVDIAIDLKGFTQDNRVGIFAHRAAPLQISFLGYPGTMGASFMDYLVTDRTLVPEPRAPFYTEKLIYMPHSYQVNDASRAIAARSYSRAELKLPAAGFVFCCFNNAYKITPAMFERWMRILGRVDGSVLWLLGDNPTMIANLRRQAAARGISPERLVFADRIDLPNHLARHRAADLFIDTAPCNAHTTASDALWAGLPVLTCPGESFAARVAASLLTAVGLTDLIASTPDDYETMAIHLATHPEVLRDIRCRLQEARLTAPLFDTPLFCRHFEWALTRIHARHLQDAPIDHLDVGSGFPE